MRFRHLLSVLACGLVLAACGPVEVPDDDAACAGFTCTAGTCFSNAGQPMCRCGAWEAAAGVACEVAAFEEPDEIGGSPERATVLTLPMPVRYAALQEGRRPELRDRDLFAFTAVPGHAYAFRCGPVTLQECKVRVLDDAGHSAPRSSAGVRLDDGSWVFNSVFQVETEGPWYVEVSHETYEGTYTYQLVDLGTDDYGDSADEAAPLQAFREPAPFPVTHSTPADLDVFSFRAVAGHGYRFSCEAPLAHYDWLRMTDANGKVVDELPQFAVSRAAVGEKAAVTSDWFVEVRVSFGAFPVTSSCRLEDLGPDEHADGLDGATPVVPGVPVSVTLQSRSDVDVLTFTGEAGHLYTLHADGAGQDECEVKLVDAQGRLVAQGSSRALTFELSEPGRYYVLLLRASAWMPTFLFTVEDLGMDDHGDTPETATDIGTATVATGRFETPQDTDAIAFTAQAGHVYEAGCEPACDMTLGLASRTPSGFVQLGPGRFLVHAQGMARLVLLLSPRPGADGFILRLRDVATDDHGDNRLDAEPLTLPATVSGAIQTAVDQDVFTVQLMAFHQYRLTASVGSLWLVLTDPFGTPVSFSQDGVFVAGRSGTYMVRILGGSGVAEFPWSFALREQ